MAVLLIPAVNSFDRIVTHLVTRLIMIAHSITTARSRTFFERKKIIKKVGLYKELSFMPVS
jgi:hypothetical protein